MDSSMVKESTVNPSRGNYYTIRYGLIGFTFGLIFPVVATVIVLLTSDASLTLKNVIDAHLNEPLLWIIDTAPLFLGFFATLVGRREDRLQQANQQLEDLVGQLELRVTEQARDLDRAVVVGHSVSQARNPDEMMAEAIELIRSSFDFYYIQVFLVDASGRYLDFQAGTGSAGVTMRAQRHRIPLGLNSIVGTAAIQRRTFVVADATSSHLFQPNPLLPDTRAEMAMPLLIGNEVTGILDIQSNRSGQLTTESLPALEAVAGQLAIAIENARLVVESTEARAEIELQARRIARSGWQDFMNAIDRQEYIGFAFEADKLTAIDQPLTGRSDGNALSVPIVMTGEPIGTIRIQGKESGELSTDDAELVASVADQVARQVESLRLLAEADRYREEAEEVMRRLTREGWEDYMQSQEPEATGFDYDLVEVKPLSTQVEGEPIRKPVISRSLAIRGEPIGQLEIADVQESEEYSAELVGAVAEQLSAHIEGIRLSEQREKALAESEKQAHRLAILNELSQTLAAADSSDDIYQATAIYIKKIIPSNRISLSFLNDEETFFEVFALHDLQGATKIGDMAAGEGSILGYAVAESKVVLINQNEEAGVQGIESFMVAPLTAGGRTFGTLNVGNSSTNAFDSQDEGILLQIASLVATTIESRRLFVEAQHRAEEMVKISQLAEARADELAILNQMGQELTSLIEITSVISSIYRHTTLLMQVDNFYLALYDESIDVVDIHLFGEGELFDPSSHRRQGGHGITEHVIRTNQSLLLTENVAERMTELGLERYGPVAKSWVGVPLTTSNQVIGMIAVQDFSSAGTFGEHERELLIAVASQAAIAIENSNLFQQEQARSRREQILREITARVRGSTDVDSVMRTAAQEVGRALGRQTFVYLSDGEEENPDDQTEEKPRNG